MEPVSGFEELIFVAVLNGLDEVVLCIPVLLHEGILVNPRRCESLKAEMFKRGRYSLTGKQGFMNLILMEENQGMSPYEAPEHGEPGEQQLRTVSGIPKVMGILHLVFGGISLMTLLMSFADSESDAERVREQLSAQQGREIEMGAEAEKAIQAMESISGVSTMINLAGALALLIAGIGLVKYRAWGRTVSNVYVVLSFVGKLVAGYIFLGPMSDFMTTLLDGQPDVEGMSPDTLKMAIIGAMLVTLVVMSIYMVVTLILVNKKSVRDSLS